MGGSYEWNRLKAIQVLSRVDLPFENSLRLHQLSAHLGNYHSGLGTDVIVHDCADIIAMGKQTAGLGD